MFHPSPRLRVTSPTPRRAERDTPRPGSTHANYVCAGPGVGRWALACSRHGDMLPTIWAMDNRPPRPNHPRKIAFSWGPVSRHPSIEGNFIPQRYEPSSPPLEGWRLAAGVVRECGFIHLLSCHSRAGGNRAWIVISYLIWEVYSVLYFHPPAIRGTI